MKSYFLAGLVSVLLAPVLASAAPREVVVYSFITDAGRSLAVPTRECPSLCRLGSGGYHKWGGLRAGEKSARLEQEQALPVLASAGAAVFGRDTPSLLHHRCRTRIARDRASPPAVSRLL